MPNIIVKSPVTTEAILAQMKEDAKFDVADDVSFDESLVADIRSKRAPPKVPKVFLSNNCIFNCAYCGCRNSYEEKTRYCSDPAQLARISVENAEKNGHGVFITSAIHKHPDYTEELIIRTLKIMREELKYPGYIHAKIMPGTDPRLIEQAGRYANRLSVNIEVARSEGYSQIAHQKNKTNILTPMQQISDLIKANKPAAIRRQQNFALSQTTQLMAGSTGEDDRTIMVLSKALYKKYDLKRVYYTAFQYRHPAAGYDLPETSTPTWRVKRLYQADRLLQLYGFTPDEITPESSPNLSVDVDPKAEWALRNLHMFPVEVNKADFDTLIRVPGIGITFAQKIIRARKYCVITHDILRKIGVSLKRSIYFITCNGRYGCDINFLGNPSLRNALSTDSDDGSRLN